MSTLSDLQNAVREYCDRYHIDHFPVSDPYDIKASWTSTSFPYAGKTGCYAFFDDDAELAYLGKASCGATIGRRAATYFWLNPETEKVEYTGWPDAWERVTVLHTIPVHEPHQAPSLEEYLIERLHPKYNRNGRKG